MNKQYTAPDVERRRVFLEEGVAAKASFMAGSASVDQTNWTGVADETVGAGTDKQGDVWFGY
jgi:hypothetical protein